MFAQSTWVRHLPWYTNEDYSVAGFQRLVRINELQDKFYSRYMDLAEKILDRELGARIIEPDNTDSPFYYPPRRVGVMSDDLLMMFAS